MLVEEFIKNNGKTYRPGSDAHLELRRLYIGCSELYKANGTLNMIKNVIKGKLFPQPLKVIPVTHGVHFEDNCEEYVKYLFNNKYIYKAPGSILNSKLPNIACSPDGLGYMNVSNFDKYKKTKKGIEYVNITLDNADKLVPEFTMNDYHLGEFQGEFQGYNCPPCHHEHVGEHAGEHVGAGVVPCLFEYKSPFSRKLKDGYISYDYEYQIQGGMQVVDICNYACFFEGVFRQCSLGQLFESWDYEYNYNLYEQEEGKLEIAKGIKLYFLKPEFFQSLSLVYKLLQLLSDFETAHYESFGIDFGSMQYFKDFFVGLNESLYEIVNIPMFCKTTKDNDSKFYNSDNQELTKEYICEIIGSYASKPGYLGFVCWKLYDYQVIIEKRSNIITEKELRRCECIMECIKAIDSLEQLEFIKLTDDLNPYLN